MTCNELQKDLALMAAGALRESEVPLVRDHMRVCPGCAARFHEYESVCAAHLTAVGELEELPIRYSDKFLKQAHSRSFSSHSWSWLIPLAGAAAAILLLMQRPVPNGESAPPQPAFRAEAVSSTPSRGTLARYRQALARPGEGSLDSLLAQDADLFLRAPSRNELQQLRSEMF